MYEVLLELYAFYHTLKLKFYIILNNKVSIIFYILQVIDENDNNPTFIQVPSNLTIREDAPPGTVVTTVTATDPDSDDYGLVTYLLDRKSSFGKFEVRFR